MQMNQGLRRGIRSNRTVYFTAMIILAVGLIAASQLGVLAPIENIFAIPLNAISGVFNRLALRVSGGVVDLAEINALQERNAQLEEALADLTSEVVDLREMASDYDRVSGLLNYTTTRQGEEFLAADVIAVEQTEIRSITINRGARDSVQVGMPVVTDQGLVGRVVEVQSNAARVLLITDISSNVSARLQTTRAEGTVRGQDSGSLNMIYIPLGQSIADGDIVLTSGLGGILPADLVIGQVTSSQQGLDLYQTATVRSRVNFDALETVLVVTNFQPVDLSAFESGIDTTP